MLLERDIDHWSDSDQGTDYVVMSFPPNSKMFTYIYHAQIQNLNWAIKKELSYFEATDHMT